ncbi:potassium transporter TrkA [Candidatus Woesearchaeota archaeon]|nr:potassium transporter TrkA [Candidatus Woesearchaeota archaeon]
MLALLSFIIVILFSLIVVKIGAIALEATGLSKEISQFQSQSAFSGVGFTTQESETLMGHPLRRKILRFLMLMGSAGLTSAVATLILTFMNTSGVVEIYGFQTSSLVFNITTIIVVLLILFLISRTETFDHIFRRILHKPLHLIKSKIALYDYEKMLGLSKGHSILSFDVFKNHWMANKKVKHLKMEKEGVTILGIFRNIHGHEEYVGVPSGDFKIEPRDKVVVYAREPAIANLVIREKGQKGKVARQEAERRYSKMNIINRLDEEKMAKAKK